MSQEHFSKMMSAYSTQAEAEQQAEARLLAKRARADKIRQALGGVLVALILTYGAVNHAEIRDGLAKYFPNSGAEYQGIMSVADELAAEKTGSKPAATTDPNSRRARLKEAMQKANDRAAIADGIMDHTETAPVQPVAPSK
jgi:hypothetical protein